MSDEKIRLVRQFVDSAEKSLASAQKILRELTGEKHDTGDRPPSDPKAKAKDVGSAQQLGDDRIVEGVFDGLHMVGPDGKQYSVPSNYASKSKLVEGDVMKLTITPDGTFLYKQIQPIDRDRLVGVLTKDEETAEYHVLANGHHYRVLLASVTYFKGTPGDEAVILVPKGGQCEWAAVENIIKTLSESATQSPDHELPSFPTDESQDLLESPQGSEESLPAEKKHEGVEKSPVEPKEMDVDELEDIDEL